MNDENEVLVEIRRMSLMLFELISDGKDQKEKILLLSKFGYTPKEIAEVVGTTSNTVSVTLARSRKRGKTKTKGKTKNGKSKEN